jgi:nitroimidazol reductase NimA-like FMN-containing flavoprotein (pyridoxamine 5'-phosphate oxidase superfamily)
MMDNRDRHVGLADRGLQSLSESECWRLLDSHDLGRVAFMIDGWPQVFPVNYAVGEGALLFRSAAGAKASHGPGSRACFEIDGWSELSGVGWSVMAQGTIRDISYATDRQAIALRQVRLYPAAPGVRDHLLALMVARVTGRRFGGPGIVRPVSL